MRKAFTMLALVLVSGLTMSFTISKETEQALEEYKQIVEENTSYRTYGAESGLKGNYLYQFSDAEGYRWYTSNDDGYKIYRFNGIRFDDVISRDRVAANDTMLPGLTLAKTTGNVYALGIHNLYRWQDYYWKKYSFPARDRILKMREYDNDIYCVGEKGLGVLKQGVWVYRAYKDKISEAEASIANADQNGIVYSLATTSTSGMNGAINVYIKQFSSFKTGLMPVAQNLLISASPQTCFDYRKELLWIYIAGTDLLYKYSLKNMLVQKVSLVPGTSIQSITTTDKGNNWLITKTSSSVKATELSADYPKNPGMEYSSEPMTFEPGYLDYLYLEDQLLPVSSNTISNRCSRIRILEANAQTQRFSVKELVNPSGDSNCKQVYNFGNILVMDMAHAKFRNISHILILKYPFERFIDRDVVTESETYWLGLNRQMNTILIQRKGRVTLVPHVIVCEFVAGDTGAQADAGIKPDSVKRNEAYFENNSLRYMYNRTWQTMDIKQFEMHGVPINAVTLNGIIWLGFENALLRYDPKTKITYAYTAQEGIPNGIRAIYSDNGKLMIKTADALYKFNEYKNTLKLDIPYIIVSDSLRLSVQNRLFLPYTHRRIEIPLSILGPLYPELCPVTYRLLGYNDDWMVMEYLERIRYLRLPFGSYTFEASAMAANGEQTSVKSFSFRIMPPWYYTWYAFGIYIMIGLGLIYLLYRWRLLRYRETNRQLELQVAERTHELQEWQLRMTQSIDYALLIQKSILPQEEQMQRLFKHHFILWHPRDTVGGDFYWLHQLPVGNAILFAVIDCTGHGVPGALVSMTVNAALNHIVKDHGVNTPEAILRQLHQDIGLTLHQESEKSQQDGLDIALVKIDFAAMTLDFAGAALDMLLYEQDRQELIVLQGSKYSIGGLKHRKSLSFEPQQASYTPNSKLYMYTDGILDQTNEINLRMKRLGPEQWQNTIRDMGNQPFAEHKAILEGVLKQMLLLDDQRDDITIVGLQL